MLEMGFFRRRSFTGSASSPSPSYFSIFSIFFFVALYLEVVVVGQRLRLGARLPAAARRHRRGVALHRSLGRPVGSRVPMTDRLSRSPAWA